MAKSEGIVSRQSLKGTVAAQEEAFELLHSAATQMAAAADALESGGDAVSPEPFQGPGDTMPAAKVSVRALYPEACLSCIGTYP